MATRGRPSMSLERGDAAVVARRDDEAAARRSRGRASTSSVALGLADEIPAGDAGVGRAVGDELGDVLRADEDRLELAAERGGERALAAGADLEPGVVEQLAGIVGEPSLVGQRDSQHSLPRD